MKDKKMEMYENVKITIEIENQTLKLTLEKAKKLHGVLDELFGKKVKKEKEYVPYPYYPYKDYWYPCEPYYPWITWTTTGTYNPKDYTLTVTI